MSPSTLARRHTRRLAATVPATVRGATRTAVRTRARRLLRDDAGMSTVEYAIGCIAAAAFAAVLYAVVSGDSVVTALTQLVQRALTARF
jgi:Flp pilus assembly pilin Flp